MNRAGLIEAIAKARYGSTWGIEGHTSWENLHADTREYIRDEVLMSEWTLIVDFVLDWIERDGDFDDAAVERAERWRESMSHDEGVS